MINLDVVVETTKNLIILIPDLAYSSLILADFSASSAANAIMKIMSSADRPTIAMIILFFFVQNVFLSSVCFWCHQFVSTITVYYKYNTVVNTYITI